MSETNFWDNLVGEINSLDINFRASDIRRFKASLKDKVFAFRTDAEIREKLIKSQQKKIDELEKKLAEVLISYIILLIIVIIFFRGLD